MILREVLRGVWLRQSSPKRAKGPEPTVVQLRHPFPELEQELS